MLNFFKVGEHNRGGAVKKVKPSMMLIFKLWDLQPFLFPWLKLFSKSDLSWEMRRMLKTDNNVCLSFRRR